MRLNKHMKQKIKMLSNVDMTKLREYLKESGGDGWTIWHPVHFTEMGFALSDLPVHMHRSDFNAGPKQMIADADGNVLKEVEGVYNLAFLRHLAAALGANTGVNRLGRGSEARALSENILKKL
jgi:hypothetical protein